MTQAEIKALIDEKITSNGAQEITGEVLNDVLQEIADACGYTFDIDVYPADAALEITFYNPDNPDGVPMKINAEVSNLGNSKLEAISAWWAAQTERKLNKTAGYDIDLTNVSTSPSTLGVTKVIEAGQIIQSFTGASKLIFGATDATNVTVNSTDLPYTATKTLYNVKLESGTAANLKITVANGIVSVSQNTSTGHTDIIAGGTTTPVCSTGEFIAFVGKKYAFSDSSYREISFNAYLPIGTIIDKSQYTSAAMYFVDIDGNTILKGPSVTKFTTDVILKGFMPTDSASGEIVVLGTMDDVYSRIQSVEDRVFQLSGVDVSFVNKSYATVPFGFTVPSGTILYRNGYSGYIYLYDKEGNEYNWSGGISKITLTNDIISFKPTTNDAGRITSDSFVLDTNARIDNIDANILNAIGVDVSFVNKSYATVPFNIKVPIGTVLFNNGYSGLIYLHDKEGNSYNWTTASQYYTAQAELVSFMPTTNDAGRITSDSKIVNLLNETSKQKTELNAIKTDIGLYHCNIWGGQVNFGTGQLYNLAYNNYHFSDPVPIDEKTKYVYCPDNNVARYMFYSAMPVIGENTGIYLGYRENYNTDPIPSGAKYAVVVFVETYVPSVQPFDVFVNKIAYEVNFSKKMQGKKLVTIGDSLTQSCSWQPKLMRFSGMNWSFNECYGGVGYVNLNNGTYTTDDKSADTNYRHAYPTALYGTPLRPTSNDSIYIRSLDVKFYEPDIIFIYGGENDAIANWVTSENTGTTPEEIVANETPYLDRVVNNNISAIAAYKGLIENLMSDCPNAVIYIVNSMPVYCEIGKEVGGVVRFPDMASVRQWEKTNRYAKVEYMREIAKYYSLPLIDLWNKAGINDINSSQWYGETAADATQVHPDRDGYLRMADVMLQCL